MIRRLLLITGLFLLPSLSLAQDATVPDSPAALEFYGTVQSASATALVVNGQLMSITGAPVNTPLVVGMVVRVQGVVASDGTLTISQIDPVSPGLLPGIVELNGTLTALQGTTAVIGGETIDLTTAQVVGSLTVGQFVRVYAVQSAPGTWTARSVIGSSLPSVALTPEVIPPNATPDVLPPVSTPEVFPPVQTPEVGEDFEIEGTVQAFDANTITIDGSRYFIGSARIDNGLFVGARVRLEIRVVNGEWIVEEVDVRSGGGDDSSDDNSGHGGGDD